MEGLQLAQMLADLSSLNEAVSPPRLLCAPSLLRHRANLFATKEPPAASALLSATKTVNTAIEKVATNKPQPPPLQAHRPGLPRTSSSASSPGGPLDRLGRSVFGSQPSSRPGSVAATAPGTPTQTRDVRCTPLHIRRGYCKIY
ncbi:hypothetical protein IMZ48_45860 [Candidatus Bathyarchaeota archaeon]|nr:hypothetical protein [Candidatus Bathyarchaeota archaeon]